MARDFKELRESVVKTADKKPEKFTKPDGKIGIRMVPVDKQIIKNEAKVDEISMTAIKKGVTSSGMKNVAKAMGKDKLKKDLESMKARMATEATDAEYHKTLGPTKNSDEGIAALKKKHGMSHDKAVATLKRLMGEAYNEQVDEVLDRPGALDSYRKKADASGNKARNSATRKILTAPKNGERPDHSAELKTMKKRNKGQDMADRVAARQFRKSIGRPYINKESVEYVNEKLKVSDGMGAWVDDFKKSDAPQFKGKSDKERREMAIAAYLSAKRGDKK